MNMLHAKLVFIISYLRFQFLSLFLFSVLATAVSLYCSRFKFQVLCMYISSLVYVHALVYLAVGI